MVKKTKNNKIKEEKFRSEEQIELIRFIKILLAVIVFIVLIYFVTRFFVKKDIDPSKEETAVTEVSYNKMIFGTLLNRPYEEYYVVAFSSKDNEANYYNSLISNYVMKEDSIYVYYIDLEDSMNKDFIADANKSNPNAKTLEELQVGELTLIKVENGKIVSYKEDIKDIKSEFNID